MTPTDDGSRLWLRYDPLPTAARLAPLFRQLVFPTAASPTAHLARAELTTALPALLGRDVPASDTLTQDDALLLGTHLLPDLTPLGDEGFLLRRTTYDNRPATLLTANTDAGLLYGAFHLLRLLQSDQPLENLNLTDRPKITHRLLNHWDNLDGSIERGYAGKSLWQWPDLPGTLSPRYAAYARACASIGINGTVLNNVNANPKLLTPEYLDKVAALATVFRPYHLRVYLSANFAAPKAIGPLPTADPADPAVRKWWRNKTDEIYKLIPDFGGFLVKANSEGQPGPQDYGRSHADGANCLADALAPHHGIVLWRAFVYDEKVDPDRAKRAYLEFTRLDGQFRPNVTLQIKNGPIDFQPREPFHPLFGALKQTNTAAELQITQEYLGHANHLVYLATMWTEFLDSPTRTPTPDSTVAQILTTPTAPSPQAASQRSGAPDPSLKYEISNSKSPSSSPTSDLRPLTSPLTAISAVANTGSDANWTGHDIAQSNWYAFGRLAWDPALPAEHVAEEWLRQTLTHHPEALNALRHLLLNSRETFVNYSMPLGLHHLIDHQPHYAPEPWNDSAPRPDWTSTYYHRAAPDGIGFDRTRTTGDHAVDQYAREVADTFNDPHTCPEKFLLYFHHLPWTHPMASGRTLWQELIHKYTTGAAQARAMKDLWATLAPHLDPALHARVAARLAIQANDAAQWRDACLAYFAKVGHQPLPKDPT